MSIMSHLVVVESMDISYFLIIKQCDQNETSDHSP